MKFKGKTEIQLRNVKTGEVETIHEENMVTNAISKIFDGNIEGMLYNIGGSGGSWNNVIVPICTNAIGGILLFSEALAEDANNIYAPSDNFCVGYSSNDVNATANTFRGSLNLTETTKLDKGYKFVWDFTTSQANGTISALALTHKFGGISYFGDLYNVTSKFYQMKALTSGISAVITTYYTFVIEVNFKGNYLINISMNSLGNIVITKVRKCFCEVGLNFSLQEDRDEVIETKTITPSIFINPNASSNYGSYDFFDGLDGYWYGFMGSSNNSGNASVKWIKIKKEDYSYTEGVWTLSNVLIYQVGQHGGYNTGSYRFIYSVFLNGYIYFMHYNRTGMYKVNVNNSADITWIPFGFTSNFSGGNSDSYNYTYVYVISGRIIGSDFIINSDDTVIHTSNANPLSYTCSPVFMYGPYAMTFGRYTGYGNATTVYKNYWLVTPYLATINNLSTAVVKTADKTMKITYTVTETT